jgi:hypothetical protein
VIEEGVELVLQTAVKLLGKKARRPDQALALAIEDKRAPTDDEEGTG